MKISLIYPQFGNVKREGLDPPLGLMYLAAVLEREGHHVNIIDNTFKKDRDEFKQELKTQNSEVIGIYSSSSIMDFVDETAKIAKKMFNDSKIVVGGPHVTVDQSILKKDYVDFLVLGEGEIIFPNLIRAIEHKTLLKNVNGIAFKKNKKFVFSRKEKKKVLLDALPFPAWDLVDYERYIHETHNITLITSRGCGFNCSFCQPMLNKLFGKGVRRRSVEGVVKEIKELIKKYSKKKFIVLFLDDCFTSNKKWVKEFCNKLIDEKIKIAWWCNARVDQIDEEVLLLIKSAGCMGITSGVESGSQKILDYLKKDIKVEQIKKAFKLYDKLGILSIAFVMVGTPTETRKDIEKTIKLIEEIKPDILSVTITTPIPGSKIHEIAKKTNILNSSSDIDFSYFDNSYPLKLKNLNKDDIKNAIDKLNQAWKKNLPKIGFKYLRLMLTSKNRRVLISHLVKLFKRKLSLNPIIKRAD